MFYRQTSISIGKEGFIMRNSVLAFIILLACSTSTAYADDACAPLSNVVSRPTVTNSACTVSPNHVLFENGYLNNTADTGGNSVSYPQTLIRIGTSIPRLEVQAQAPSLNRVNGQHGDGDGDVGAGLKYLLKDNARYQISSQINLTLPTGDTAFTAKNTQTAIALNGAYAISSRWTLATTQSIQENSVAGARYQSYVPSLVLSSSLPHNSAGYLEYALITHANGPGTGTRNQYILGALHDIGYRLQIDVEDIYSPTISTGKYNGIGFGVSYLL